jgi:hypothetical protein
MPAAACLRRELAAHRGAWLAITFGVCVGLYLLQLGGLILRFGTLPNYVTWHDWPANVARIIRSTPAVTDMIPIILDEWLIEIGSMNYSFGRGIAEWSLVLMPAKLAMSFAIGALLATNVLLLRAARRACRLTAQFGTATAAAAGTLVAAAASTSITWVVCCAAPSWVVGLAVMGLSTSTALVLQPFGGWLMGLGLVALAAPIIPLARAVAGHRVPAPVAAPPLALASIHLAQATP